MRVHVRTFVSSLSLLACLGAACTSRPAAPASAPSTGAATPQAQTPHTSHGSIDAAERTTLLGNLGEYRRPIRTTSPEAQAFFDEGLTLLYGFNHEEAYRSFARAAALDPEAPMPHWGMSLSLGTNYNDTAMPDRLGQAYRHLEHARARASNGSDVERAFVEALGARYAATPDDGEQAAREAAYSNAMGLAAARFPDDLDAGTLYAESMMNLRPWKLYNADGEPVEGTDVIVRTLESVLTRDGRHPGANHYYIHAVEASRSPERAVTSARQLETLVPGAGHLVHMPAHVYIRTGDYLASAKSNAQAARVDERYVSATGAKGMYPVMYYGHNLQFESAALMFAGQFQGALDAARKTVALVAPLANDIVMLQPFAVQDALVLARFGKWDDVLRLPAPPAGRPVQAALHHFVQGTALANTGAITRAVEAQQAFELAAETVGAGIMISTPNRASDVLGVARHALAAQIADARADRPAAIGAWKRAVVAEDALSYNEPPDWLLPTREGLGAALLRADEAAAAEAVFRADLLKHRANPRSLFGLSKSLEQQGKRADAKVARKQFEHAWRGADARFDEHTMRIARQ